jgi:hypothetical protein
MRKPDFRGLLLVAIPITLIPHFVEERYSEAKFGFTQGGADLPALTESDILGPSEAFRHEMDYFSHTRNARDMPERSVSTGSATLACMHGNAWRGDGAQLLRALANARVREGLLA